MNDLALEVQQRRLLVLEESLRDEDLVGEGKRTLLVAPRGLVLPPHLTEAATF